MTNEPSDPNEHVDETLRDAFAVDDDVAGRLSAHALAAPPRHRRRTALLGSLALAVVTLCAGLVAWLSRPLVQPSPGLREASPRHEVATSAVADTELTGSLVDGILTVSIPGDGVIISGPGQRDDRPPEGSGIVIVEGDAR